MRCLNAVHLHLRFYQIFRRRNQSKYGRAKHTRPGIRHVPTMLPPNLPTKVRVRREADGVDDGQGDERRSDALVQRSYPLRLDNMPGRTDHPTRCGARLHSRGESFDEK